MAGSEMNLMPYKDLGAKEISQNIIHFGILLPDISERDYAIWVRIIHEDDQFIQDIPTVDFEMKKDFTYPDYWRVDVEIKAGEYYFYNHFDNYLSKNILLFHRKYRERCSMVALNFGDWEQTVPVKFPLPGEYTELLHGDENLENVELDKEYWLKIPVNYGRIWDREI